MQEENKPEIESLTDWKIEPKLEDLKYDFTQAQASHSKHVTNLKKWEDIYEAKPRVASDKNKRNSTIEPKLVRKQAEWRCPALSEPFLSTPELFKVDPTTHEDKDRAIQNELILNYQFTTKIKKIQFIDTLIRTLVKEGTAIVRVGWDYQEEQISTMVPVWAYSPAPPEIMEQLQPYLEIAQTQPDAFTQLDPVIQESVKATLQTGVPHIAQQVGEQEEIEVKPIVNKPSLEICNSRNVYIDPTCEGNIDKAQFVIHSFETNLSELRKDGRYKNLDNIRLENADNSNSEHHSYSDSSSFSFKDNPRKKITVYEYWGYRDIDGSGIVKPIVASWVGSTLIRLEENPFPDQKLPFVMINYIPTAFSIYGIPDAELLEDNQKVVGALTRGVMDLMGKSANSQTGVAKGMLDATNRARFRNGDDYEYNPNSNPQAQIFMHKFPEVPQSAMWLIQQMHTDAEAISGVKAFSGQGISGAGLGETAAGVRSAMDAASKREMSVLRRISEGIIEIGRKILSMNSEFLSEEEVIRITNSEFITVRRDDLAGNFDLRLTISTAEADEAKAQELAMMLQTIGNNMDMGMRNMILAEIARLRKMPDLAFKILNFQPEPDPMQQQLAQLEMQKLQAEIAFINAQAAEAGAKSQLQAAKIPVEQARAESLQGDADLKSQNFVDNMTGVNHAKEMDKKALDVDAKLQSQELKNRGALEQQIAQFGLNKHNKQLEHKSDLLKMKAQQDFTPTDLPRQV